MKRWGIGFAITLFWALLIVLTRSTSTELLRDSDTKVMLQSIEKRGNAWSWFAGDWPLENHFYRPIVAETFELDHALYGWKAPGYGLTNAILCGLCVLALFWLLREVVANVGIATLSASLFGVWHLWTGPPKWGDWIIYLAIIGAAIAVIRAMVDKSIAKSPGWLALAGLALLSRDYASMEPFRGGMIDWVPGRTTSTMALLCLLAMAAYARYERISARRDQPEPDPLDPPATRGTELVGRPKAPWIWPLLAAVSVFLALASYEQAVMLPACLIGVAIAMRLQHYRPRWGWHALFWAVLVGYFVLRNQVIPPGTSNYQAQQFRAGPGVFMTLFTYLAPATPDAFRLQSGIEMGWFSVLLGQHLDLLMIGANLLFIGLIIPWIREKFGRRDRTLVVALLFGLVASFVAFAPMAWFKPFTYNHYHYWPLALRSLYVGSLMMAIGGWFSAAWSRRAVRAPQRPVPAPGSLPHP